MERTPQELAGYRIVRTLGRGGMGTVYLAEQDEPVERRVALKVLRQTVSDDDSGARFLAERHAMGRLDHPNVGRILEAGEDEQGRPFFAMEWLDGLPLDVYCEQHQLSIPERLEVFVGVCRGVAHAHQKQLLHRDIKPSNILVIEVDGRPVPKVIDFGVAKALDQPLGGVDLKTQHVLGTPIYTSPEGLRLREVDLDTRSDVYSLGVLLCELLVGRRPHELGDDALGSFLRRKAEEDPTSPSDLVSEIPSEELERIATTRRQGATELRRALRGDLDWIVLKAVARKREDRYASADELAADVERYLRSEPILARAPALGYLVGKFVRRHRGTVIFAGALLLAFLVGVAGLAVGLRRAQLAEARSRADAEAARLSQEKSEAVSAFLSGLFLEASPQSSRVGEPTSSATLSAKELVERGAERAAGELADQPDALAEVQSLLGDIYGDWGEFEKAAWRHRVALKLAEESGASTSRRAGILLDLGEVEIHLENWEQAEAHLQSALDLLRRSPAVDRTDDKTHDPADDESLDDERTKKVRALVNLGRLARSRGDYDRAVEWLREAQAVDQQAPLFDAAARATIYTGLTSVALSRGRPEDAETPIRIAYELTREQLPDTHPIRVDVANHYAVVLAMQDKLEEARPMFEETLELRTRLFGRRHFRVAEALNNLGVLLIDLALPEEALPFHREALEIRREVLGEGDSMTAWSLDNLGVALIELGRYEEALEQHRQALAVREAALDPDHPLVARSLFFVGKVMMAQGRDRSAIPYFRRCIEIRDAKLPADHTGNAEAKIRLGALLLRQGDPSGAALIRRGLPILEAASDEDLPDMLVLARSVGVI